MQLQLIIEGNLAVDPVLRYLADGTAVANLRVMHTARVFDRTIKDWRDGATTAFDVSCWRGLAENVAELKTGDLVVVTGNNLEQRRNGDYVNLRVNASTVAVSARRYPASSHKPAKTTPAAAGDNTDPWGIPTSAVPVPA